MTTQIAIRLPDDLVGRLDALVPGVHETRSEAIRRSIELYLYRLACEQDADRYDRDPLSDAELVAIAPYVAQGLSSAEATLLLREPALLDYLNAAAQHGELATLANWVSRSSWIPSAK